MVDDDIESDDEEDIERFYAVVFVITCLCARDRQGNT